MFLNFLIKKDDLRIYEPSYQGYKHNLCKIISTVFLKKATGYSWWNQTPKNAWNQYFPYLVHYRYHFILKYLEDIIVIRHTTELCQFVYKELAKFLKKSVKII